MSVIKRWNEATSEWEVAVVGKSGAGVPLGGSTGNALVKSSASDYATSWRQISPFNSTTTAYVFPAGMQAATTNTYASFGSTVADSSLAVVEVIFDVGSHNASASSISFEVGTSNNGAGALASIALYQMTSQRERTFLRDCGTALIGTTGAKQITFTATSVPRYVAAHFALRNLNTGGSNPTFLTAATAPPVRALSTDVIFSGAGGASAALTLSTPNAGAWPSSVTMNGSVNYQMFALLGVQP